MQAYLVRQGRDRQVVGIFVAKDVDQLAVLIDECCDPSGCEYLPAGPGGIFQSRRTDAQFPIRYVGEDPHPDDGAPFVGADYTDSWHMAMDQSWRSVAKDLG